MVEKYGIMSNDGNILESFNARDINEARKIFNERWRYNADDISNVQFFKIEILKKY